VLVNEDLKCDRCHKVFYGIAVYSKVTCKRCHAVRVLCPFCMVKHCRKCNGLLETEQETNERLGLFLMY